MTPYLYLIVTGLLLAFGSFAFAAYNMARHAQGFLKDFDAPPPSRSARGRTVEENPISGFGAMFAKHMGAMVAMGFGSLIVTIGVILAICDYLNLL